MTIMTTEEVQELISNQPDEQIIKELRYIIQYEPDLLKGYPLNRTLFHLLILQKKPRALISLINEIAVYKGEEYWKEIAVLTDSKQCNLMHYTVRMGSEGEELMMFLLEHFPEQVKAYNKSGNTPLHEAAIRKKIWTINFLVKYKEIAVLTDNKQCNLMHYTVRMGNEGEELLMFLLEHFPEQVNACNESGNTPLHEAVIAKNIWAINCLVKHKGCNKSIKNKEGKTALELAADAKIRQAILSIDLSTLLLGRRDRNPGELQGEFPLLASNRSSPSRSSPNRSNPTTPIMDGNNSSRLLSNLSGSSASLSTGSASALSLSPSSFSLPLSIHDDSSSGQNSPVPTRKLADVKAPETLDSDEVQSAIANLGHDSQYKTALDQQISSNRFKDFYLSGLLPETLSLNQELFSNPANQKPITDILTAIQPGVTESYRRIEERNLATTNEFITIVTNNISISDSEPRPMPELKDSSPRDKEALHTLWLLTACQTSPQSKRKFNFEQVEGTALGLLLTHPLVKIIQFIKELYSQFDKDQKIIANFIVLQLIAYNAINKIQFTPLLAQRLQHLGSRNIDKRDGLGPLGEIINSLLAEKYELCSSYYTNPILWNGYLLNGKLSEPELAAKKNSFDQFVDYALQKTPESRVNEVELIAHELLLLTMLLYRKISIIEFRDQSWQKDNKAELAPVITRFTNYFNQLFEYFAAKILTQPPANLGNALRFMIELGQVLCPLEGEFYRDLNHFKLVASVLSSSEISRLYDTDMCAYANQLACLTPAELGRIKEIEKLSSAARHSEFMRKMYETFQTTLPFPAEILQELIYAVDGNKQDIPEERALARTEAEGKILKKIIETKALVAFERTINETDLLLFIEQKPPVLSESDRQTISYSRVPRKDDFLPVEKSFANFTSLLARINERHLPLNILPRLIIKQKTVSQNKLPSKLIELFTEQLKKFLNRVKVNAEESKITRHGDIVHFMTVWTQFEYTISQIIQINNNVFSRLKLTDYKNPADFAEQLNKLRAQFSLKEVVMPDEYYNFVKQLTHILANNLPQNLLPDFTIKQKEIALIDLPHTLINFFEEHLKYFVKQVELNAKKNIITEPNCIIQLMATWDQLEQAIFRIILINNQSFYPKALTDCKNPYYFIERLKALREQFLLKEDDMPADYYLKQVLANMPKSAPETRKGKAVITTFFAAYKPQYTRETADASSELNLHK
ncbi:RasGEF domain-containing protein [Legionella dresdenensis]|uniref:RasGEF domain-containing protein n=1 Tax=Legionella dresdenensis TaxID=450200 RepID=A0ABV8CHM7_9GAMM